jgi:hypothetical protein
LENQGIYRCFHEILLYFLKASRHRRSFSGSPPVFFGAELAFKVKAFQIDHMQESSTGALLKVRKAGRRNSDRYMQKVDRSGRATARAALYETPAVGV